MLRESPGERLTAILDQPGGPALVVPEDGQVLTYGQVADGVASRAGALAAAGGRRGARVALTLPNGPDMVLLLLAITALGAAAAPLNPAYTRSEYVFYLTDIAPRVFVLPASRPAAATSAADECSMTVLTARADGDGPPMLLVDDKELSPVTGFESGQPDDVGIVLHTSGTTSRPKQVPLCHVHGLIASTFAALAAGGSVIVSRRFTPQRFWRQAREHGATWLSAGPTLHQMILERADEGGAPATLRFARSCSSALSTALMERAEHAYGVPMLEAYGMTEASHQMASNPLPPGRRIAGSVGVCTLPAI